MWKFLSALLLVLVSLEPSLSADADNGRRIARRWCVSCHVVAQNQRGTTGEAPSFSSVAQKPNFDETKLAFFLLAPHPKMPNMGLSRKEATDLASYIATLH